ncbi:FAD-dependent oxidoreductase [Paenibacillus sp. TAB 01]|uniref:FAD-dependent oxidoreductase n=1 Tax=Paenibacillus sp. TAB 01 TaxID=3368988 RepID=UPI003752A7DC
MDTTIYHYEVAVIGGGPAGIAAAIASARSGVSTVLVEPSSFLGGAGTGSLVRTLDDELFSGSSSHKRGLSRCCR